MKVYVILYETGIGATVHSVKKSEGAARKEADKLNGSGIRHGTYIVVPKELE